MEYKIISKDTITLLELEVKSMLRDGWKPIGGVVVFRNEFMNRESFLQTMTKGG